MVRHRRLRYIVHSKQGNTSVPNRPGQARPGSAWPGLAYGGADEAWPIGRRLLEERPRPA